MRALPFMRVLSLLVRLATSQAAHALEAAKVLLSGQDGQAKGDNYGDERPSEPVHA